jgi:hypothetical protein
MLLFCSPGSRQSSGPEAQDLRQGGREESGDMTLYPGEESKSTADLHVYKVMLVIFLCFCFVHQDRVETRGLRHIENVNVKKVRTGPCNRLKEVSLDLLFFFLDHSCKGGFSPSNAFCREEAQEAQEGEAKASR